MRRKEALEKAESEEDEMVEVLTGELGENVENEDFSFVFGCSFSCFSASEGELSVEDESKEVDNLGGHGVV